MKKEIKTNKLMGTNKNEDKMTGEGVELQV